MKSIAFNISRAKQDMLCTLHKGKRFYMVPEFAARNHHYLSSNGSTRNKESAVPISITPTVNFVGTPLSGESYFQPIAPSAFPLVLFFPVTCNLYLIANRRYFYRAAHIFRRRNSNSLAKIGCQREYKKRIMIHLIS